MRRSYEKLKVGLISIGLLIGGAVFAQTIHVDSITPSVVDAGNGEYNAQLTVTIKDDSGQPQAAVKVLGVFLDTANGPSPYTFTWSTTDAAGVAVLVTADSAALPIDYHFKVINLLGTLDYAEEDNLITDVQFEIDEIAGKDTENPSMPLNLRATATTATSVTLAWDAATDNVGVTRYKIRMDNSENFYTETATSLNITGLSPDTAYVFKIKSYDAAKNSSNYSSAVTASTSPVIEDIERPRKPTNLRAIDATTTSITLAWDAATDNVGVTRYMVRRDSEESFNIGNFTSLKITGLAADTDYDFKIKAYDAAGNSSFYTAATTATTTSDDLPPEVDPNARLWPLINASFEESSSEGGWYEDDPSGVVSTTSSTTMSVPDGDRFMKINGHGGTMKQAIYQPIAGHRYEVSAWVYNHGTVEVNDVGSDSLFETSTNHGANWKKITVTFVSTGSPALIHAWYGPGSGESLFDQFEVKDVTTEADLAKPVPTNIIRYPSQILDLSRWKITLPINDAEEVYTPILYTYSNVPWFKLVQDEDGYAVQFRANHGGATTGGSNNPRSELREMAQNYHYRNSKSAADWSNTDGKTHSMWIKQKVTRLTSVKPQVVVGQIHDNKDDVTVFRIEGHKTGTPGVLNTHANLWITNGDDTHGYLLDDNYEIGTVFTVKFISSDGETRFEYNEEPVPYVNNEAISGCYFKLGTYTQSHEGTAPSESDTAYAETYVYDYEITHE